MNHSTERLTLQPMTLSHAEALFSYRSLPVVNTYTYTPVWTSMDDATAHVEQYVPMVNDPDSGFGKWMIVRNDTGDVIGDVLLNRDAEMQGATEIGFMFHPDHGGQGFATEAVRAVLGIGFEQWGEHRIYARVDEDNVGSVRVCQKLGMRQEARLIENDKRGDIWSNELIFAMLDREWTQVAQQPPGLVPPNEYYRTLPRRYMGAGMLFTDPESNVLLVKTSYKDVYELPGGVTDAGESPRAAAQREVLEELGISIEPGPMLVFDSRSQSEPKGDAIMIVYDGGVIEDPSILRPDGTEVIGVHFASADQLDDFCTPQMAARLRAAMRARELGQLIEIQDGQAY